MPTGRRLGRQARWFISAEAQQPAFIGIDTLASLSHVVEEATH